MSETRRELEAQVAAAAAVRAAMAADELEDAEQFAILITEADGSDPRLYVGFDDPISAIEFGEDWIDDVHILIPNEPRLKFQVLIVHDPLEG